MRSVCMNFLGITIECPEVSFHSHAGSSKVFLLSTFTTAASSLTDLCLLTAACSGDLVLFFSVDPLDPRTVFSKVGVMPQFCRVLRLSLAMVKSLKVWILQELLDLSTSITW